MAYDYRIETEETTSQKATDWLEARQKFLGGSESFSLGAEILGVNYQWSTPFTVYCEKNGYKVKKPWNKNMIKGQIREPIVREKTPFILARDFDIEVDVYQSPFTYTSKNNKFLGGNVDGVCVDRSGAVHGLEIKTTMNIDYYERRPDGIPFAWWAQIQHYIFVTGLNDFFLIIEIFSKDENIDDQIVSYQVFRDDIYLNELVEKARDFWQKVESQEPPEPSGSAIETPYLQLLGKIPPAVYTPQLSDEIERIFEINKLITGLKKDRDKLIEKVKEEANGEKSLKTDKYTANFNTFPRSSFDTTSFKRDYLDLYNTYKKEDTIVTTFTVTKIYNK